METNPYPITGTEIAYLHICRRKLWLFHHGIRPENEHSNVQVGRFIQESTFTRHENNKEISLGRIGVVDWAELDKGIIHEIKKGKAPGKAELAQTRYYMWWMRKRGMNIHTCIIHYPSKKRTERMVWHDEMVVKAEEDLRHARKICDRSSPPKYLPLPYCEKCAYQEYCAA